MKKTLLALGIAALGVMGANATDYTVFDIANPGNWTGDANGWSRPTDENGFTIQYDRAQSTTDLISPAANEYAWRVYKNSSFTITSANVTMKSIVITYDTFNDGKYLGELVMSEGWTGTLVNDIYTVNNAAGSKTFTGQASNNQVRIKKIVVSDEGADAPEVDPSQGITVFDIHTPGEWTGDVNGWSRAKDANGFTLTYDRAGSTTDLISPAANSYAWRVYKGAAFTLTSETYKMDEVVITYDTYTTDDGKGYVAELVLSDGWTGTLDENVYTLKSNGLKTLTATSEVQQVRITKIVVKGEAGVTGVAVDNAPAAYYNLQGVRVANPEKGIYIVVKNGKSSKVMF